MSGDDKLQVVVFPWLAFGHMNPFLELAIRIAQKGHQVSFVSTAKNIDRLQKTKCNSLLPVDFIKLNLPSIDGLPKGAEATIDLPSDKVHYLKKAYDLLETELTMVLESLSPDWVIYDFAPYWLPPIAKRLGISRVFFNAVNSWFLGFLGPSKVLVGGSDPRKTLEDFTVPPEWVPFETSVAHRYYEIKWIAEGAKNITADVLDTYRLGSAIIGCDVLATRDCKEFEPDWLRLIQELNEKIVLPLGFMPSVVQEGRNDTWDSISYWLNIQRAGSVIYVGLGSELLPNQETVTELALGLEKSELPFFWALRSSHGSNNVGLPDGFEERTKDRGMVWTSWVPQLRILAHDSVGAFLTHCGWSSMIEGLQFGRPLIMLPFMVEQGLNARIFEKNKLGVEVTRNERDGSFTRNSVAETIKLVMTEEEGAILRSKASAMKSLFGDKLLHDQCIDNFVEYLKIHKSFARNEKEGQVKGNSESRYDI